MTTLQARTWFTEIVLYMKSVCVYLPTMIFRFLVENKRDQKCYRRFKYLDLGRHLKRIEKEVFMYPAAKSTNKYFWHAAIYIRKPKII